MLLHFSAWEKGKSDHSKCKLKRNYCFTWIREKKAARCGAQECMYYLGCSKCSLLKLLHYERGRLTAVLDFIKLTGTL